MRLAPLVSLSQNSLRYRLAYLMANLSDYFLGPSVEPTPRPAIMSCWRLGYKILANLIAAIFVLGLVGCTLSLCFIVLGVMLKNSVEFRWMFGAVIALAIVINLWEHFRMTKRLHIFRRQLCPLFVVNA